MYCYLPTFLRISKLLSIHSICGVSRSCLHICAARDVSEYDRLLEFIFTQIIFWQTVYCYFFSSSELVFYGAVFVTHTKYRF